MSHSAPLANGSSIVIDTLTFYWRWRATHLLHLVRSALPDVQTSSAPTAAELIYFAKSVASMCTRDLHSINHFIGLEVIMYQHHCILLAICYALGMMVNPVQRQWRCAHIGYLLSSLDSCSY